MGGALTLPIGRVLRDRNSLNEDVVVSQRRYGVILNGDTVALRT